MEIEETDLFSEVVKMRRQLEVALGLQTGLLVKIAAQVCGRDQGEILQEVVSELHKYVVAATSQRMKEPGENE